MIVSFGERKTGNLYHGLRVKGIPQDLHKRAMQKLVQLDAALALSDLSIPPSNKLKKMQGQTDADKSKDGQLYSIRISAGWRITFHWKDNNAYGVAISNHYGD